MQEREALALLRTNCHKAGRPATARTCKSSPPGSANGRSSSRCFLRNRFSGGEPLPVAIDGANRRLDLLTAFDPRDETERGKAIPPSASFCPNQSASFFGEFGVFPEDGDIPLRTLRSFGRRVAVVRTSRPTTCWDGCSTCRYSLSAISRRQPNICAAIQIRNSF
jgi:hypothetical protein